MFPVRNLQLERGNTGAPVADPDIQRFQQAIREQEPSLVSKCILFSFFPLAVQICAWSRCRHVVVSVENRILALPL
jgi:hypothetical protein